MAAVIKNWVESASKEIADLWPVSHHGKGDDYLTPEQRTNIAENLAEVIARHCPFEKDTAYVKLDVQSVRNIILRLRHSTDPAAVRVASELYKIFGLGF